jgi:hypothetical protein
MYSLTEEVKIWNTPLIGAYLLWRFTQGYTNSHETGESPIALLHFVALAILSDKNLAERISDRRPDLNSFVRGFNDKKDIDRLLMIHSKISAKKKYTLSAIDSAIRHGLITWNTDDARIYPRQLNTKIRKGFSLKESIKRSGNQAEILGKWFSKHEINEISSLLKVTF